MEGMASVYNVYFDLSSDEPTEWMNDELDKYDWGYNLLEDEHIGLLPCHNIVIN